MDLHCQLIHLIELAASHRHQRIHFGALDIDLHDETLAGISIRAIWRTRVSKGFPSIISAPRADALVVKRAAAAGTGIVGGLKQSVLVHGHAVGLRDLASPIV